MKIILFTIFFGSTLSMNPQSVNLAVETTILFEPKDAENNLSFIKNLRDFLDKLQIIVSPKTKAGKVKEKSKEYIKIFRTDKKDNILTDFLIDLGIILVNHTDENLKKICDTFNKIVDELYFKESLFHEVFIDSKLKNFIRSISRDWKNTKANELKNEIQNILRNNSDPVLNKFFRKLNKYFDDGDNKKLKKIAKRIYKYPRKNRDLNGVISDGLKYVIFDHYNALNYTSKLKLADQLQKLTKYLTEKFSNKILDPDLMVDFRRSMNKSIDLVNFIKIDLPKVRLNLDDKIVKNNFSNSVLELVEGDYKKNILK